MKYKISRKLILGKKGKKITIFNSEKSSIYELNEIGSLILKEVDKEKTVEEIINLLKKNYKVQGIDLLNDINDFIKQLKKKRIIIEE